LGFDGSDIDDWTGIRLETLDGYQFTPTYGPDERPTVWNPAEWGGQVPRLEVMAAFDEVFSTYNVVRAYLDPPYWESEADTLAERYGEKRVVRWYTNRIAQMHSAAERLATDVTKRDATFRHDGCVWAGQHIRNARKAARPAGRYLLKKASESQKIDVAMCSILAHEAAGDAVAAGQARPKKKSKMLVLR
jgi:phage terminase large subunit-like protein